VVNRRDQPSEEKLKTYMMTRMEVLQKAGNYKETIQPGHFDHFEFVDDIRQDLDAWEKEQLETIIREGIERGEFELEVEVGVLIDMFIMIAKGLEIPFFLQGRYEEYRPYFDGMARILMKGMRP
jgi:hypothetical protein